MFITLQIKRHNADYDPFERLKKTSVQQDIRAAEYAISRFAAVPVKDKRAFAAYVLFKARLS